MEGVAVSHHLLQKMKELLNSNDAILCVQSEHPLTLNADAEVLVLVDERRLSYRILWDYPCSVSARNTDSSQKSISVTPTLTWIVMVGRISLCNLSIATGSGSKVRRNGFTGVRPS
jgi:hypothetical protein